MKLFCNILPGLESEVGHIFQYNLSMQQAIERQGWISVAWIPVDCQIPFTPPGWSRILPPTQISRRTILQRFKEPVSYIRAFKKGIKTLPREGEWVFFLEHFRLPHLFSLLLVLFLIKFPFQVWLLHRYSKEQMCFNGKLHRVLYNAFRFFKGRDSLHFMSDSELLSEEQSKFFGCKVTTFPIPHTQIDSIEVFPKNPNSIYCWWPGGSIRESKGFKKICSLSKTLKEIPSSPIKLIIARNAINKGILSSPSIVQVEDVMNRSTYEKWMQTTDIVLLPYRSTEYRLSTSGIFVEAVTNGRIPITAANTWMAYELHKFNLPELVIDWDSPSLLDHIESIFRNREIRAKLRVMEKAYQSFHSTQVFSNVLYHLGMQRKSAIPK